MFGHHDLLGTLAGFPPAPERSAVTIRHARSGPLLSRRSVLAAGFAAGTASLMPAVGKTAVGRTARILVGFPAGGTTDVIARLLAGAMKDYAPAIVVENRPGRAGTFALESLKAAPHDGSVLMVAPLATTTLYPHLYKALRFDPLEDFIPVTTVGAVSYVLAVSSQVDARVRTLADFIVWCRASPDPVTFGSPGTGSPLHFTGVQLARAAGFAFTHVPHQGAAPTLQDLLTGQIAWAMLPIDTPLPYLATGPLRALATSGPRRSLSDVPTFRELGYSSLESVDWWGVFVAAGTPAECVDGLARSTRQALETISVRAALAALAVDIDVVTRDEFSRLMKSEYERWGGIVLESGFSLGD
jgi:tripartite-type tricarboxylate transporter receptor subunit TctC